MIAPEKLLETARTLEPQLVEWRRTLHRHPEVGFDLPETKALVKKALTEMGYTPQDCGKCGVLALALASLFSKIGAGIVFLAALAGLALLALSLRDALRKRKEAANASEDQSS